MFAITTLIKAQNGSYRIYNGALVPSPTELRDQTRVNQYLAIGSQGWSAGDFGYWRYATWLPSGEMLIFPALELLGERRASRKFPGFQPLFTRKQIEALAASYSQEISRQDQILATKIDLLVHDLRALSNAIYHAALEAQSFVSAEDNGDAYKRIENVIASQNMLKMRTDALDFEGNRLSLNASNVPIFRKVDKVVRCFKPRAASQNKIVELSGNSYFLSRGPEIFELVPYALIDNGLKYSPPNKKVIVSVNDGDPILLTVTSFGPRLRRQELELIFETGMRAEAAQATGLPGSGLGLAMAKKIITMFNGSIHVQQSQGSEIIDNDEFFETTFTVSIPASI